MRQLSPQDAQFLYMETEHNLSNTSMLSIYQYPDDNASYDPYAATAEQLDPRLHTNLIFTHHIKQLPGNLDHPYWVIDPYFRLQNHLIKARLPAPGNWDCLRKLFAEIHSKALDLRRPPWEIHVITGLKNVPGCSGRCFALVLKVHHAAGDDAATLAFFQSLHDDNGDLELPEGNEQHHAPGRSAVLGNATRHYTLSPLGALSKVLSSSRRLLSARRGPRQHADDSRTPVPHSRFNTPVAAEKTFNGLQLPAGNLEVIQQLVENASLTDVILAICSGGLHRYLDRHGELPNVPLVAWVPLEGNQAGQTQTAAAVRLASQILDPVERLQRISGNMLDASEGRAAIGTRLATELSPHIPAAGLAVLTRLVLSSSLGARLCNLAVSNLPGPEQALFLSGAKCLQQYRMVPLGEHMGLFIVALSYHQQISLSITSTGGILPDMDFMVECLIAEFECLLRLATTSGTTAHRHKPLKPNKPKATKAGKPA